MPLYKGFAEVRVGGAAPWRRFLLDLDLHGLDANQPTIWNYLDVDGAAPQPDVRIRITPQATDADDTRLEIRVEPLEGREIRNAEVRVFFNADTIPGQPLPPLISPVAGVFPDPSHWIYVAYRGDAGQTMPRFITFGLGQRAFPATGTAAPLVTNDVDVIVQSAEASGPLHLAGGMLEGPAGLRAARSTTFVGGIYAESAPSDVRWIGLDAPFEAPTATTADFSVQTPGRATFPLECFWLGIGSDHSIDPPALAPPAVLAGAGAGSVDAGAHRYKVSFVLANGNETKPSPASAAVTVADPGADGRVRVTLPIGPAAPAPPATPDPGIAVVGRRVYRTVASATGDDGEYLRVGDIANNADNSFVDNVGDGALGDQTADRLVVHYSSLLRHDLEATILLREAGIPEDRFEAVVRNAPTEARVAYTTRPAANRPRVHWQADAVTGSAELRLPNLRSGNYTWAEARVDSIPRALGAHWFIRGATQTLIEIGGTTRGASLPVGEPLGRAEVALASAMRPWRDSRQAVRVEVVEKWFDVDTLDKARLHVGVHRLRYALLDIGALTGPGRHARAHEGVKLDVRFAPRPGVIGPRPLIERPGRALRLLMASQTFDDKGTRTASHISVRAGHVPDSCQLDLRSTPETGAGGEYFGAHLTGNLSRVKLLALTDPAPDAASWLANDLAIWVTVPDTGPELDIVRNALDAILTTGPIVAEASIRHPRGLSGDPADPDPFRHVKGLLALPGTVHIGPAAVAFGTADAGSTAINLVDGDTPYDATWNGGSVRFLTGALADERQAVTAVAADGSSLTTNAFSAAPAAGDAYVVEVSAFAGLSFTSALEGIGAMARVALAKDLDRFVAARATPQVAVRNAPLPGGVAPTMRSVTARAYGVRALAAGVDPAGPLSLPVLLNPDRVNKSLRAGMRELDTRFAEAERDLLKARIETVPPDVLVRADIAATRFEWRAVERSGRVVFWAEPGLMRPPTEPEAGSRFNTPAGIGLAEGQIDGLPRWLRLTVLPSSALPPAELVPRNFTPSPPTGWRFAGMKAEVSEMSSIDFLRLVLWNRDHRDDLNQIFWSRTAVRFLRWNQDAPTAAPAPPVLTPLWIWAGTEIDPADENKPGGGLAYRITTPGVTVTLDLDQFQVTTNQASVRWDDLTGWDLAQELQMSGYAGECTVASQNVPLLGVAGDESGGPGNWFLKIIDGRPWYIGFGSAYFGNTSGVTPFTRARLFA